LIQPALIENNVADLIPESARAKGLLALVMLVSWILMHGSGAFMHSYVPLAVELPADKLDKTGNRNPEEMKAVSTFGYAPLIRNAVVAHAEAIGFDATGMKPTDMGEIISKEAAAQLRNFILANPESIETTVTFEMLTNGRVDGYMKGRVDAEMAAPGILTGTIIGLAQALGEPAPLLLIGMVAFVREYTAGPPEGFFHLGNLFEFGETGQIFTNPSDPRTERYITGRIG